MVQHRNASIIDPLTSMLNRNALAVRVEELRHQAAIVQQPIGLIVCDLDHFKAVNDNHGHAIGDAVLRGRCLRPAQAPPCVRPCLPPRRRGVPGAPPRGRHPSRQHASLKSCAAPSSANATAASRSRCRSESAPVDPGYFDYEEVFEAADQALYTAKAAGRNCVRIAGASDLTPPHLYDEQSSQFEAALQA